MAAKALPNVAYLRTCLDYDPRTGEFRWKERPLEHFVDAVAREKWNTRWVGKQPGSINRDGYRLIRVARAVFVAHRIAWLLERGDPIPAEIDHRDGNPDNNRIDNLRAATRADNLANNRTRRDSQTGVKGVYPLRGGYVVWIRRNKTRYYLGRYRTLEEAAAVRREAAERLHGEFARHG